MCCGAATLPFAATATSPLRESGRDGIFDPKLLMDIKDTATGKAATYNFVLAK